MASCGFEEQNSHKFQKVKQKSKFETRGSKYCLLRCNYVSFFFTFLLFIWEHMF